MLWKIDTLLFFFTLSCLSNNVKKEDVLFHSLLSTIFNYNTTLNFHVFTKKEIIFFTCFFERKECVFCVTGLPFKNDCPFSFDAFWGNDWIVGETCLKICLVNNQGKILWQYPTGGRCCSNKVKERDIISTHQPFRRDGSLNFLIKDTLTKELKLLTLIKTHNRWIEKVVSLSFIPCEEKTPVTQTTLFIDTLSQPERLYIKPGYCDSLYVYEPSTGYVQHFWIFHSYRLIMVDSNFVYGFYKDYWGVFEENEGKRKRKKKKQIKRYVIVHDKHTGDFLGIIPIPRHWVSIGYNWYEGCIYFADKKEEPIFLPRIQVYRLKIFPNKEK